MAAIVKLDGMDGPGSSVRASPLASAVQAGLALAVLGTVAVVAAPELAPALPWGDRPEPNPAQVALTTLAILALTAAGLWWVTRSLGSSPAWLGLAFAYNAGIALVKFVVSPAAYSNHRQTSLAQYLAVGVAVMALYAAGLVAVYRLARRHRTPLVWTWASKLPLVLGLLVFAMASRFLASVALDSAAAGYLGHVFSGAGLWLPALIVGVSVFAIQAFDAAAHPGAGNGVAQLDATLAIGLGLVAVYHGLWALYMVRLFS